MKLLEPPVTKLSRGELRSIEQLRSQDYMGRGSYSKVYLATAVKKKDYLIPDEQYAIKRCPLKSKSGTEPADGLSMSRRHFEAETRCLYNLRHENIAKLFGVYVSSCKNVGYIVMAHYSGGDLFQYTRTHLVNGFQMAGIFRGINLGLKYCHDRKIYHQDVKPQNILLDSRAEAVLADFGFASVLKENETTVTTWVSTPGFYGPEASSGEAFCPFKMDVYSMGMALWQVIFQMSPRQHNALHVLGQCTNMSPYFRNVLQHLLEPNPNLRWGSVEFEHDFRCSHRTKHILHPVPTVRGSSAPPVMRGLRV